MAKFCASCGTQNEDYAQFCRNCQAALPADSGYQPMQYQQGGAPVTNWQEAGANKKMDAGLCGILLGGFGVHKFILGYTTEGIIQIVVTFVTCGLGSVIGLVEGIIYLTKSDEEFVRTYIQNKKGWF